MFMQTCFKRKKTNQRKEYRDLILFDPSLDMDIGTQALIEFLDQHIESLSPYEILGLEPTKDKVAIRQAYLKRSRLFHPDRYFRKNIGSYASVLSSLFKAVTRAFSTLQSFDG